jgi:hypothetical protein
LAPVFKPPGPFPGGLRHYPRSPATSRSERIAPQPS